MISRTCSTNESLSVAKINSFCTCEENRAARFLIDMKYFKTLYWILSNHNITYVCVCPPSTVLMHKIKFMTYWRKNICFWNYLQHWNICPTLLFAVEQHSVSFSSDWYFRLSQWNSKFATSFTTIFKERCKCKKKSRILYCKTNSVLLYFYIILNFYPMEAIHH